MKQRVCPPHFFRLVFDDKAHRIEITKPGFLSTTLSLFLSLSRVSTPRATLKSLRRALSEFEKEKRREKPALAEKHRSNRTMAEAFDTRELTAALDGDAGAELTITDLPNDVLVSIFEAVGDLRYVKSTPPPASARSGLSSTARGTQALCTRRSRSTF